MTSDWRLWPRPSGYSSETAKCAGYNIVLLAVAITVLNILVAKALPLWSTVIQREKEEELIFRGLQYAEAIRLFEGRAQRLPTRLEELIEVKPRCIRKLWPNPMTEDGSWGLIFQDQQGQQQRPQAQEDQGRRRQGNEQQSRQSFGVPGDGKEVRVGPIVGVYSTEGGDAVKVFAPFGGGGGTDISEWRFTKDLLQGLGVGMGTKPNPAPSMNAAGIGKPWPPGIIPPSRLRPDRGGHAGLKGPLDRNRQGRNVGGGAGRRPANGQGGG